MKRISWAALELILPVGLVALWWLGSMNSTSVFFPPLSKIWDSFVRNWLFANVMNDVLPTLASIAVGYALAVAIGVSLGVALGVLPRVYHFVSPLLEFFRALPPIVLITAFIFVIGVGFQMEVMLVVFGAVWPILLNTIDGVVGIDPQVRDMARSYRLSRVEWMRRVLLPAASPQIVAGMKVGLSATVIIVIVTEMVASVQGLGYFVLRSQSTFDMAGMWSAVILMGLIGYVLNLLFGVFEHFVLAWHRGLHHRKERS